jgi:hypothetical protein
MDFMLNRPIGIYSAEEIAFSITESIDHTKIALDTLKASGELMSKQYWRVNLGHDEVMRDVVSRLE